MNDIARIAGLLADPARAKMLWSLIDGSARPAGELAYSANVSAQSASGHLAKLVDGRLERRNLSGELPGGLAITGVFDLQGGVRGLEIADHR